MARYHPNSSTKDYTNSGEFVSFRQVTVSDPAEVADIEVPKSKQMWISGTPSLDGNVVYIDQMDEEENPFVYQSDTTEKHVPSADHNSRLVSAPTDKYFTFKPSSGWTVYETFSIYPISDYYLLEQLGETHKLLVHKV